MNVSVRGFALLASSMLFTSCTLNKGQELTRIFADYIGNDTPGAAILVIHNGEKVLTETFGLANVVDREPVQSKTNFRLASITKQFTAMSILMLVDRGELRLDDSLQDIFPEFPEFARDITLTHILQHTSGLLAYEDFVPSDSPTQVSDRDVLEIMLATDSTYFEPGSDYRYSNSGYAILTMMVEKYSGLTFPQFLKNNIFDPLGMHNSVAYQNGISTVPNRAYGYTVTEDGIENTDQSPWSAVLGDGGIYSSIDDLYKWDQALYTDTLISADLLAQAWTPNLETYGFGWRIDTYKGRTRIHHSGSTSGFRNHMQRYPDEGLTVIVLTNRADPNVDPLAQEIADLYLD